MAVRVLLVLAALAVLYGCDQEGPTVEAQEAGAERSVPSSELQPVPDQRLQDATLSDLP
jgi:hypothetical protein